MNEQSGDMVTGSVMQTKGDSQLLIDRCRCLNKGMPQSRPIEVVLKKR